MKTKTALSKKATKFITEKLIPFMQREHGNGFAMSTWRSTPRNLWQSPDCYGNYEFDDLPRPMPPCNTIACIGGTIQHLTNRRGNHYKYLDITRKQADGLFYNWEYTDPDMEFAWPNDFAKRYENADTPQKKAAVAVSLLKKIILKGGGILKNPDYNPDV